MQDGIITPGWQGALCQFFTRDAVARFCLDRLTFPTDLSQIRLLEPAAGRGAFILPLIPRLVQACRSRKMRFRRLAETIRAYEVDKRIAARLRKDCIRALVDVGVQQETAKHLVRQWVIGADFLEADIAPGFTHIVGNPPYIRWDAIPKPLIRTYRARYESFRARADLYVPFIEKSLTLLAPDGQLAFLCPGNWTRNTYGAFVRQALTGSGRLEAIIDFTDVDSFEKTADAYPSFFVFSNGESGSTEILSISASADGLVPVAKSVRRTFPTSSAPLLLAEDRIARFVERATSDFPSLEDAGCLVRVGSATGCNAVFLGADQELPVEADRLLPFVNARSIRGAQVHWSGTRIVNVFDRNGRPVELDSYPLLRTYLMRNKKALKSRAKAGRAACWWRSIDVLQPEWYAARKLLIADISSQPVVGLDNTGYCAGSGVYQIKSAGWPLEDLLVLLSAGILGTFVSALSQRSENGFNRFQKKRISTIPLPPWEDIEASWLRRFREARLSRNATSTLRLVAELYQCDAAILAANTARDWPTLGGQDDGEAKRGARKAMDGERADGGQGRSCKSGARTCPADGPVKDRRRNNRDQAAA